MAKLAVYNYILISPSFAAINPGHKQAHVYVAAESAKRAAELFGVRPDELRTYGGIGAPKAVTALCQSAPDTVFVHVSHSIYVRMADAADAGKRITLDMRDEEVYGRDTSHAAFGQINISRVSGQTNLFMVDHPQDHYLVLEIHTATLNRNHSNDRLMSQDSIIRVAMSEVQWARMIASPNTAGVPCTLQRYFHPKSGDYLTPELPEKHAADIETFKDEVKERADKAVAGISAAKKRLDQILDGGALRKGDLAEVKELLRAAEQQIAQNLTFVVETAEEKIEAAAESAKAEVDAHIDFAMQRLGERALGDKLAFALEQGIDIKALGRSVELAVTDQRENADG